MNTIISPFVASLLRQNDLEEHIEKHSTSYYNDSIHFPL